MEAISSKKIAFISDYTELFTNIPFQMHVFTCICSGFLIRCVYGTYAGYIRQHYMAIGIKQRSSIDPVEIQQRSCKVHT